MKWCLNNFKQYKDNFNEWEQAVELIESVDEKLITKWITQGKREGIIKEGRRPLLKLDDLFKEFSPENLLSVIFLFIFSLQS